MEIENLGDKYCEKEDTGGENRILAILVFFSRKAVKKVTHQTGVFMKKIDCSLLSL